MGKAMEDRATLERVMLAAIAALWPDAGARLGTASLAAYLSEQSHAIPTRALYLRLEGLQQAGLLRLSRANPEQAAAQAHGERTITWVNPAIFD
jgi:hypothetical protein